MRIFGTDTTTYLYLNGLAVPRKIVFDECTELWPVASTASLGEVVHALSSDADFGVAAIFLPLVRSQIRVTASDSRALAVRAWNSLWDAILLGAFCGCCPVCNIQGSVPVEQITQGCKVEITNYHFRGYEAEPQLVTTEEADWIEANFHFGRKLLDDERFQLAVHALYSYRWHSLPRAQLALLWSGLEGLFKLESELAFRLSLYVARFLEPSEPEPRLKLFNDTKKLYGLRSSAVHGSRIRARDLEFAVTGSATLLRRLVRRCVEIRELPRTELLAP